MKLLFLFFALVLVGVNSLDASEEDFSLEGVMYEVSNPEESTAIVNGQFLKQGDSIQNYQVEEVGSDYVVLQPQGGGEEVRVGLTGPAKKSPAAAEEQKSDEKAGPVTQQAGGWNFNFGNVLNMAAEVKAQAELKQIFVACASAAAMEDSSMLGDSLTPDSPPQPQLTLQRLVEIQMLPKTFETGQSGPYTYTIDKTNDWGFEIHANPTNPKSSLRHFMIDQDGIWHAERGKPATSKSPTP